MENMDIKPAAKNDPIKDTPYLKEPITNSYLGKRLRHCSAENQIIEESESECNILNETLSQSDSSNVTTELNYDDNIKLSANVKKSSYFNILECGRNVLHKLDVTYQSAFTASEKLSTSSSVTPAAAYVDPLKKILYSFTASEKPSTPSSVPRAADYVSPLKKKYWDVQTDNFFKMEIHKLLLLVLMPVLTVFRML